MRGKGNWGDFYRASISGIFLFSRLFLISGQPHNVFYIMPTWRDELTIFLLLFALIFCLFSGFILLKRLYPPAYPDAVTAVLLVSLTPLIDWILQIALDSLHLEWWKYQVFRFFPYLYPPAVIFFALRFRWGRALARMQVVLLPLAIVVLFYAFPKHLSAGTVKQEFIATDKPPVHLIILDEVNYDMLFDPRLKPLFPHFFALAEDCYIFSEVHSPGCPTMESLPDVICGSDFAAFRERYLALEVAEEADGKFRPLPAENSIFKLAQEQGLNSILIGAHLPYCDLFGGYLTWGKSYRITPLFQDILPWAYNRFLYLERLQRIMVEASLKDYLARIETAPGNSFFYAHIFLPHRPFIFDENGYNGYYWQAIRFGYDDDDYSRYVKQMRYTDKRLGEIIGAIRERDWYEQSLIIVTSDHNDRDASDPTRIPLLVKAPLQRKAVVVEGECNLLYLKRFLEEYFRTGEVKVELLRKDRG